MLEILYGAAGSGKTAHILTQIRQLAQQNKTVVLLVPEQFSFDNERLLLERLGAPLAARVQVLSFSRLAELVLRRTGNANRSPSDELTSLLLLSEALRQTQDQLTHLRGYTHSPEAVGTVLQAVRECKSCIGSTDRLIETAVQTDEPLRTKLLELATVIGAYDALLDSCDQIDSQDLLTLCSQNLAASGFADGTYIFVDSFKGFTGSEEQILQALAQRAAQVTVTLCTDTLDCRAGDRFFFVSQTAKRLQKLAARGDIASPPPVLITPQQDTRPAALQHLQRHVLTDSGAVFSDNAEDALMLRRCPSRREEAAQAVRHIRRYLRQNTARLRDVTIVVRDLPAWQGLLDAALRRAGLPFYMDTRRPVQNEPLFATITAALSCAYGGWDTEQLLRLTKLGLVCTEQQAQLLESYCFVWSLRANEWLSPFSDHPDGLEQKITEESQQRLQQTEQARLIVMQPLLDLRAALRADTLTGVDFATAVSAYLQQCGVTQTLQQLAQQLRQDGQAFLADQLQKTWQLCMQLLEKLAQVFVTPCAGSVLVDAFRLLTAQADLGSLPQSVDCIRIGQADRIRYNDPKLLVLPGANDGEFPATPSRGGVLTDTDRVRLSELDLPFLSDLLENLSEEYFYAYAAVSAPQKQLYVSCCETAGDGQIALPSVLWNDLTAMFPHLPVSNLLEPETAAEMFELLASGQTDAAQRPTYRAALQQTSFAPSLQALERAAARNKAYTNSTAAQQVFHGDLRLSASRINTYYTCPFSYFCKYELHLTKPEPAALDARIVGNLTHKALQELLPQYLKNGLPSQEELNRDVEILSWELAATLPKNAHHHDHMRFLLQQAQNNCVFVLRRVCEELQSSRFIPAAYELPIGPLHLHTEGRQTESVAQWCIPFAQGRNILLGGEIDRVDLYTAPDGKQYLRIIDYKSSTHYLRLEEMLYGLNLQMLLYLFALRNSNSRFSEAFPAGALYLNTTPAVLKNPQHDQDLRDRERMKQMKSTGMLLDNAAVLQAMESEPGTYLSVKFNEQGALSHSKDCLSVSADRVNILEDFVVRKLTEMANGVTQGVIPAKPHSHKTCENCPYGSICGSCLSDPSEDENEAEPKYSAEQLWEHVEKEVP